MASDRKTQITVAVIAGSFALLAVLLGWYLNSTRSDTKTSYQGRVIEDSESEKRIKGAEVSVETTGLPPDSVYTDDKGIFHLELSGNPKTVKIKVYANGYEPFDLYVPIVNGELSDIRLKPVSQTPSPTPAIKLPAPLISPGDPSTRKPPPRTSNANNQSPTNNANRLEQRRMGRNALDNNN